ncbi:DUF6896 domain-containing protein [Butyrivibrio sp. LB2008]|uniref:DUF6896 domain-containing protein n=1 Tax=Butyrivibrio sp. LB2008 TaxID=1408305 RepID=UPI00047D15A1
MHDELIEAYKRYYRIVECACVDLIDYYNKIGAVLWDKYSLIEYLHQERIFEICFDEKKYLFHGGGCTVMLYDNPLIDWDFGYRSWWCGIDPYKMARTLKADQYTDADFYNGEYIQEICEKSCLENIVFVYKNQYYINLLSIGAKELKRPETYDKMIVRYKDRIKEFPKTKSIDKFLRKSTNVYSDIESLGNLYFLSFFLDGTEVGSFVYRDIAFPETAAKIMNDEIIKPHKVDFWNNI